VPDVVADEGDPFRAFDAVCHRVGRELFAGGGCVAG
jgi:hypothetical protein